MLWVVVAGRKTWGEWGRRTWEEGGRTGSRGVATDETVTVLTLTLHHY